MIAMNGGPALNQTAVARQREPSILRPLHLLGLMPPDYRFDLPDEAPLMLPGSIPPGDQGLILAFFQQVITNRPLPMVEVDWPTMLQEPSSKYLEHVHDTRGSKGTLLVVNIRQRDVDLREVAAHRLIWAFEYAAICNTHPGGTELLRPLLTLTRDIREYAEIRYDELAPRLSLDPDGCRMIADFLRTLQSPIDVLEAVNELIEVQLEEIPPEEQRHQTLQRMLFRLLEWRPTEEISALLSIATCGVEAVQGILGGDAPRVLDSLRAQGLLRDGKLRQWAGFLEEQALRPSVFSKLVV